MRCEQGTKRRGPVLGQERLPVEACGCPEPMAVRLARLGFGRAIDRRPRLCELKRIQALEHGLDPRIGRRRVHRRCVGVVLGRRHRSSPGACAPRSAHAASRDRRGSSARCAATPSAGCSERPARSRARTSPHAGSPRRRSLRAWAQARSSAWATRVRDPIGSLRSPGRVWPALPALVDGRSWCEAPPGACASDGRRDAGSRPKSSA